MWVGLEQVRRGLGGSVGLRLGAVAHFHRGLVSVVVLSLASAVAYGFAAVLQHHMTTKEPHSQFVRIGLLVALVRRPVWLLGIGLDGVGYLLQFLALRRGSLALVEPLLVLSLVVALPVAARLEHGRISLPALGSSVGIIAGVGLFLGIAQPGAGHPDASAAAWAVLSSAVALFCGAMVLGARSRSRRRNAVLLALGSGVAFGYVAALTERIGHTLGAGLLHTLATWEPYALVVAAAVALLLTQGAFQAGALHLSLPTLTVAQPLVAIVIGVGMFGEHVNTGSADLALEVLGLALITAGTFLVAQSPLIAGLAGAPPDH